MVLSYEHSDENSSSSRLARTRNSSCQMGGEAPAAPITAVLLQQVGNSACTAWGVGGVGKHALKVHTHTNNTQQNYLRYEVYFNILKAGIVFNHRGSGYRKLNVRVETRGGK